MFKEPAEAQSLRGALAARMREVLARQKDEVVIQVRLAVVVVVVVGGGGAAAAAAASATINAAAYPDCTAQHCSACTVNQNTCNGSVIPPTHHPHTSANAVWNVSKMTLSTLLCLSAVCRQQLMGAW